MAKKFKKNIVNSRAYKYWIGRVIAPGFSAAEFWGKILELISEVIVTALAFVLLVSGNPSVANAPDYLEIVVKAVIAVVVGVGVRVLIRISSIPVKIYEEQGGFEDGKFVIKPDCADTEPEGYFNIHLVNVTGCSIDDCYVALVQIKKELDQQYAVTRPIGLKWSSEDPPRDVARFFKSGSTRKVAVAATSRVDHVMGFDVWNGSGYASSKGNFHITLEIRGSYRQFPLNSQFGLDITYDGDTTFTCAQKEVEITLKKGEMGYEAGSIKVLMNIEEKSDDR